jgi:hypothetical protein
VKSFAAIYPRLEPGALLAGKAESHYAQEWSLADPNSFVPSSVVRGAE